MFDIVKTKYAASLRDRAQKAAAARLVESRLTREDLTTEEWEAVVADEEAKLKVADLKVGGAIGLVGSILGLG